MFETIREDLRRKAEWYGLPPGIRSTLRMCFSDGTVAQLVYRAARFCQTHHLKPLAVILYRFNALVSNVIVGRGAAFGPGFVILHSFGIVINSSVRAGRNLIIEHGVTIGAEKDLSPVLG